MQKTLFSFIAIAIVVGGGSFWGGMKYAENKNLRVNSAQGDFQNFRNLSPEERQQRFQQMAGHMGTGTRDERMGSQPGAGFTAGEIISKNDKSVTIKLRDWGSKIVFLSSSTEITKSTSGNLDDLQVGKNISVNGTANSDGSLTAQSIQIRPAMPALP